MWLSLEYSNTIMLPQQALISANLRRGGDTRLPPRWQIQTDFLNEKLKNSQSTLSISWHWALLSLVSVFSAAWWCTSCSRAKQAMIANSSEPSYCLFNNLGNLTSIACQLMKALGIQVNKPLSFPSPMALGPSLPIVLTSSHLPLWSLSPQFSPPTPISLSSLFSSSFFSPSPPLSP